MDVIQQLREALGDRWIPQLYAERIRPLRTRSFAMEIAERENQPAILKTLLGVELKVGRRRFSCPDLATCRYLAVFAQIGCVDVAVPYDITQLPGLADSLERSLKSTLDRLDASASELSPQMKGRNRAKLFRIMRTEIKAIGAGDLMPLFNKPTRQRNN